MVRWRSFSEELCRLKEHSTEREEVLLDRDGKPVLSPTAGTPLTMVAYDVRPKALLESFCANWRLQPEHLDLDALYKNHGMWYFSQIVLPLLICNSMH